MPDHPSSAGRPDIDSQDDPFMERLFGLLCQNLLVLPSDTFVDQVIRWTNALRFMASLRPRDQQEWLRAADVTIKQFSAVHSLLMGRRKGITAGQRHKHGQDFLDRARAMQDARLHYDLLRQSRTL